MRSFLLTIAFWAGVLPWVTANFDVYRVTHSGLVTRTFWQVFEAQAGCDEAWNTDVNADTTDVSVNKLGFRCKGNGCGEKPPAGNIDELEMHFSNNPLYHWSRLSNSNHEASVVKLMLEYSHIQEQQQTVDRM